MRNLTALSSLNAHSLTSGQRILCDQDQDGLLRLSSDPVAAKVGIVKAIRTTGQRMRVFLWHGGEVYCGINDPAAVVL